MKKLSLILVLCSLVLHSQSSSTIKSSPIYSHGTLLPQVTDVSHNINLVSRIMDPVRKRYICVFVGVSNTSATANLDFEPSKITLIGADSNAMHPMDAAEVRDMAKGIARRRTLGVMGATLLLNLSNSASNSRNQGMQVYQQMRTDQMSDAAFQKIGDDLASIQQKNLLRETVFPANGLEGYVYFDLGKNGVVPNSYSSHSINIPLRGHIYEMDFRETAARPEYQSDNQVPAVPVVQPVALAVVPVVPTVPAVPAPPPISNLQINSQPDGVDIELDGNFVGNTPTQIKVPAGDHTFRLSREGLVIWEKKVHINEGDVTINAVMNSQPMVYRTK